MYACMHVCMYANNVAVHENMLYIQKSMLVIYDQSYEKICMYTNICAHAFIRLFASDSSRLKQFTSWTRSV